MTEEQTTSKKSAVLGVPSAIVIAGGLIAAAMYFGNVKTPSQPASTNQQVGNAPAVVQPTEPPIGQVRAIAGKDHILGAKNAKVTLVEYSDLECPFCKQFHPTMQQLLKEYPNDVRWVYRHFPLDAIHSKARKEAEATECASELGGNDKFWAYIDALFEVTPSNNGLDLAELPKIAEAVGLNRAQFESCLSSGKYAQHIQEDLDDAKAAGGQGTPYTMVITASGQKFPLSGAQPYSAVKQLVDQALKSQ